MYDSIDAEIVRAPVRTFEFALVRIRYHLLLPLDYPYEKVFYVAYCVGNGLKGGSTHAPTVYERYKKSGSVPDCLFTVIMMAKPQAREHARALRQNLGI